MRRLPVLLALLVILLAPFGATSSAQTSQEQDWERRMREAWQAELERVRAELAKLGMDLQAPATASVPGSPDAGPASPPAPAAGQTPSTFGQDRPFSASAAAGIGGLRVLASQGQEPTLPQVPITLSGLVDDGDDTPGALDIKQIRHGANSTQVSYEVEFFQTWQPQDLDGVAWILDLNGDGREEGCVDTFWDGTRLTGAVFGNNCSGESISRVAVERPTPTTLRAVYDIASLRTAGLKGSSYKYRVESNKREQGGLAKDQVPDGGKIDVTHDLNAKGSIQALAPSTSSRSSGGSPNPAPAGGGSGQTSGAPATGSGANATAGTGTTASGPLPNSGAPIEDNARRGALLLFAGIVLTTGHAVATRRRGPVWEGLQSSYRRSGRPGDGRRGGTGPGDTRPAGRPSTESYRRPISPTRHGRPVGPAVAALPAARLHAALPAPRLRLALPAPASHAALPAPADVGVDALR